MYTCVFTLRTEYTFNVGLLSSANDYQTAIPDIQCESSTSPLICNLLTDGTLNLTCTFSYATSRLLMVWEVNGTTYRLDEIEDGKLDSHTVQDNTLLIEKPVNNTLYRCFNLESNVNASVTVLLASKW